MTLPTSQVQFRIIEEVKDTKGKSSWVAADILSPCTIEDINCSTIAACIKIEDNTLEPEIIPMGIDKCECVVTGYFELNTPDDPGSEITDEDLFNGCYQYGSKGTFCGRGLELKDGRNNFPTLRGKWKIASFTWDRNAKELGHYRFMMTLSYIWSDPKESQLFDGNDGSALKQNVQYFIKLGISDSGDQIPVIDPEIRGSLFDPNTAKFRSINKIDGLVENAELRIFSELEQTIPAFIGYIKSVKVSTGGMVSYECSELNSVLYQCAVRNPQAGLFKPRVMIRNPTESGINMSIEQMVQSIMSFYTGHPTIQYNPGVGISNPDSLGKLKLLPNRSTNIILPTQILSGTDVGTAIDSFLENECGFYTWYGRLDGSLQYGYGRDTITLDLNYEVILHSEKQPEDLSLPYKPNNVVVWNSDGSAYKLYPESLPVGNVTVASFRLQTNKLDRNLQAFAEKIWNDLQNDRKTYKVRFPAGITRFKEGDMFNGLGDQTIKEKMVYRSGPDQNPTEDPSDTVWQIKDVYMCGDYTEVVVGPSFYSIFDLYRDQIQLIHSTPSPTEVEKWDSSVVIVGGEKIAESEGQS
jgi:hypothetical protein